jgi:uncharacterized protein (TIGR04222 family)
MTALLSMRGPEFLALFIGTAIAVCILVRVAIAAGEPRSDGMRARDPYMIAYLRGGEGELIRVVVLSLAIRGLLKISGTGIQTVDPTEIKRADLPVEKAILEACRQQVTPILLRQNGRVEAAGQEFEYQLVALGLLADAAVRKLRWFPVLIGVAFLVALAVAKIEVALATGHSNVAFLIIATLVAAILLLSLVFRRLTRRGRAVLRELNALFHSLRRRSGGLSATAVPETTMLAAVFGVYVLPEIDRNAWRKLFPQPQAGNSSGGSGCGASGCGGGGGGGGGGCGGCGS